LGEDAKSLQKFWKYLVFVLLAGALVLWLEWLGSEQDMELIEEPVPMPAQLPVKAVTTATKNISLATEN